MAGKRNFMTVQEAATALGLTASTVRGAIHRGTLKAQKLGLRLNVIHATEVERYRQEHLGTQGWPWRRGPEYQPSRGAIWAKNYRARKKAP